MAVTYELLQVYICFVFCFVEDLTQCGIMLLLRTLKLSFCVWEVLGTNLKSRD